MKKTDMDIRLEEEVSRNWQRLEECFTQGLEASSAVDERHRFLALFQDGLIASTGYVETVRALNEDTRSLGTAWLQGIVDRVTEGAFAAVPLCQ